jgi:ssDNA-binding Zn-finger/Zn-ribbon topoisomerase 1
MVGTIQVELTPPCPECGAQMVLREPPEDEPDKFDPFFGCSRFPDCRGTLEVEDDEGEFWG